MRNLLIFMPLVGCFQDPGGPPPDLDSGSTSGMMDVSTDGSSTTDGTTTGGVVPTTGGSSGDSTDGTAGSTGSTETSADTGEWTGTDGTGVVPTTGSSSGDYATTGGSWGSSESSSESSGSTGAMCLEQNELCQVDVPCCSGRGCDTPGSNETCMLGLDYVCC